MIYFRNAVLILFRLYFRFVNLAFGIYYRLFSTSGHHVSFPQSSRLEDEIYFLSASKAAKHIWEGSLSSKELMEAYIAKIRKVNGDLNAVVYDCDEEALTQASIVDDYLHGLDRASDEFLNLPKNKSLLGVPFTVKNNMNVRGYTTLAGNAEFASNPPATSDARVVQQMRAAGAIPIAITTLPWMAYDLETWDEISQRYTCNPYDLRRTPGGSSGGEGALVGSGASIFGLGNDCGGSVRIPTGMCGCFGLKPTAGLISLDGMLPPVAMGSSMEEVWSIGPLCRHAEDLTILLRCMIVEPGIADTKLRLADPVDLSQLRLFYMYEFEDTPPCEPVHRDVKRTINQVLEFFDQKHGTHTSRVSLPLMSWASEMWQAWAERDEPPQEDSFVKIASDTFRMLLYGQSSFRAISREIHIRLIRHLQLPTAESRQRAMEMRLQLRDKLIDLLEDNGLLLLPLYPPSLPPYNGEYLWKRDNWLYAGIANIFGFPAIAIPVGLENDGIMPVCVHVMGRMYSERMLIAVAKELEQAFGGWTPLRD